jgi:ADP-dependent NAD(P)H-hydrate dehydratase / NAD(P)H-hydrate epimerase
MKVLSAAAMRAVDARSIREIGLPALVLMENAALGVVDAIGEAFPGVERVAVLCGPGNNGGDGLAVARHLLTRGLQPTAWVVHGGRSPAEDCARQLAICRALGMAVGEVGDDAALAAALVPAAEAEIVVDALFGTGLARPLEGLFAAAVAGIAALGLPVVAVDLPSGLDASSHRLPGPHARADVTVTFAAPKIAHVLDPAALVCGALVVADLGFPATLVEEAEGDLELLVGAELAGLFPRRQATAHKGDFGHVLVVAGSPGKSGAAILAARAAVRSGAGLVTAAVPAPLLPVVESGSLESMTLALPADEEGRLRPDAVDALLVDHRWTVLAVGPGLGVDGDTPEAVRRLARRATQPLVLDADGVNAFAGRPEDLRERGAPTVLTPHPGELARLLGVTTASVGDDRLAAAREAAARTGAVVVLKGHRTLVASPDGPTAVNATGNPGLASGGSGDVLTGLLAALLAQGLTAYDAACLATHLHGVAADLLLARRGGVTVAAGDLVETLGAAFTELVQDISEERR